MRKELRETAHSVTHSAQWVTHLFYENRYSCRSTMPAVATAAQISA